MKIALLLPLHAHLSMTRLILKFYKLTHNNTEKTVDKPERIASFKYSNIWENFLISFTSSLMYSGSKMELELTDLSPISEGVTAAESWPDAQTRFFFAFFCLWAIILSFNSQKNWNPWGDKKREERKILHQPSSITPGFNNSPQPTSAFEFRQNTQLRTAVSIKCLKSDNSLWQANPRMCKLPFFSFHNVWDLRFREENIDIFSTDNLSENPHQP